MKSTNLLNTPLIPHSTVVFVEDGRRRRGAAAVADFYCFIAQTPFKANKD